MPSLFLIRHGESAWGEGSERYCGGRSDVALSPRGERQAICLAARFAEESIAAVFASDLERARRTAEAIAQRHRLPVATLPELREQDYGEWEGLTAQEIQTRWPKLYEKRNRQPGEVRAPGGESYGDMLARALPALERLVEQARRENIIVVAHRGLNRVLLAHILETPLNHARRIHQNAGCVNLIDAQENRLIVGGINDCCHLKLEA